MFIVVCIVQVVKKYFLLGNNCLSSIFSVAEQGCSELIT